MNCEEKAGEVWPHDYDAANESGRIFTASFASNDSNGVPTYRGCMLIKCHGAAAVDP